MRQLHLLGVILILLAFTGCVNKQTEKTLILEGDAYETPIHDLEVFPQNITPYLNNLNERTKRFAQQENYDKRYFEPWHYTEPPLSKTSILWPFSSYTYGKSFGENLKLLPEQWFLDMQNMGNYEAYGSLNAKAISLSYLNLRNFPTDKPVFKNPHKAGEGFPFDYMQNSGIYANEPLFVSHLSRDGNWAYVFTAYATGWVQIRDVAFLEDRVVKQWQEARQIELIDEYYPIKDLKGNFIFKSRVGMRLALISVEKDYYIALAITAGKDNTATYTQVKIPFNIAREGKLVLNKTNMQGIANLMLKSHYGWGGLYEERDCSSTLRDLYAPFGLWLPRNSSQQSKVGKVISLKDLSLEDKKKEIINKGVPFETLLYKKGHILLYLGTYQGEIAILQNVWGIKTIHNGVEGRRVIGKAIISSLALGKESKGYNPEKGILASLSSMNIITQN